MSKLQFSSVSDQQISNNPLNLSPSKQRYSFAKNDRFNKYNPNCPQAYYTLPDIRNNRATTFGYGTKADFTKTNIVSPSPDNYNAQSRFDKKTSTQYGKSFGTCRDKMAEYGHIVVGPLKNPGVGNYILNRDLGQTKYSMRKKTQDIYNPVFLNGKTTFQTSPGPGQYEQEQGIKKDGKHFFAKYQSSGATTFNPPQSQRFLSPYTISPGPGNYQVPDKSGINGQAKYQLSNHRSQGTRAFTHDQRVSFTDNFAKNKVGNPGPGSYQAPSEFGQYDAQIKRK